jgi:hypothetical protein
VGQSQDESGRFMGNPDGIRNQGTPSHSWTALVNCLAPLLSVFLF